MRAREDCRGDLMRPGTGYRNCFCARASYDDGNAWTTRHGRWLRPAGAGRSWRMTRPAFDTMRAPWSSQAPRVRGDRGDGRRIGVHPGGAPAGLRARHRHADRVRVGHRDRRLASVGRPASAPTWGWSPPSRPREAPGGWGVTKTGNGHARRLLVEAAWHHRPRIGQTMATAGMRSPAARARGQAQPATAPPLGTFRRTQATPWPTSRSPANWPAGAGRWRSSTERVAVPQTSAGAPGVVAAPGTIRDRSMSSPTG